MRMNEFDLQAENIKLDLLKEHGVYIGKIKVKGQVSILFQIDSFYVEVTYRKYRHSIDSLRCIASTDKIEKYLKQIDLEFLKQPLQ